jgi:hypothetical protein
MKEAEWIPSKASSKVAIQSEVKARERKKNSRIKKENAKAVGSDKERDM